MSESFESEAGKVRKGFLPQDAAQARNQEWSRLQGSHRAAAGGWHEAYLLSGACAKAGKGA